MESDIIKKQFVQAMKKPPTEERKREWAEHSKDLTCTDCARRGIACSVHWSTVRCLPCAAKSGACSRVKDERRWRVKRILNLSDEDYDRLLPFYDAAKAESIRKRNQTRKSNAIARGEVQANAADSDGSGTSDVEGTTSEPGESFSRAKPRKRFNDMDSDPPPERQGARKSWAGKTVTQTPPNDSKEVSDYPREPRRIAGGLTAQKRAWDHPSRVGTTKLNGAWNRAASEDHDMHDGASRKRLNQGPKGVDLDALLHERETLATRVQELERKLDKSAKTHLVEILNGVLVHGTVARIISDVDRGKITAEEAVDAMREVPVQGMEDTQWRVHHLGEVALGGFGSGKVDFGMSEMFNLLAPNTAKQNGVEPSGSRPSPTPTTTTTTTAQEVSVISADLTSPHQLPQEALPAGTLPYNNTTTAKATISNSSDAPRLPSPMSQDNPPESALSRGDTAAPPARTLSPLEFVHPLPPVPPKEPQQHDSSLPRHDAQQYIEAIQLGPQATSVLKADRVDSTMPSDAKISPVPDLDQVMQDQGPV